MNKLTVIAAVLFAGLSSQVFGQSANSPKEEIIIRKKSSGSEKMTIVIDGDKVTVNGKPVEDYKSADVEISKRKNPVRVTVPRMGRAFRMFEDDDNIIFNGGNKAMLGVYTEKNDEGAKITEVSKKSAAEKAGLKKDDIITKVGDKTIDSPETLADVIGDKKADDKVIITYKRDGKEAKTEATLQKGNATAFSFDTDDIMKNFDFDFDIAAPKAPGAYTFNRKPKLGLQVEDVEDGKGVSVKDVDENTPAAKAGLAVGDIITEINDKTVAGVDDIKKETTTAKEGDAIKVKYSRNGKSQTTTIKIPKKIKTATL